MDPESNFKIWDQAIEESGLGWKYRQVRLGRAGLGGWLGGLP